MSAWPWGNGGGFLTFLNAPLSLECQPIANLNFFVEPMPVREIPMDVVLPPPPPAKCKQPGVTHSLLYNGSRFKGHQKSKGNQYDVEVILQVKSQPLTNLLNVYKIARKSP